MSTAGIIVLLVGVLLAALAGAAARRLSVIFAVLMASTFVAFLVDGSLLKFVSSSGKTAISSMNGGEDPSPSSEPTTTSSPSSTPTETPTPTPEPAPHDSSPPPWEWIGFVALAILAAAIAVVLTIVLVKTLRRAAAKRRVAKRKAIEREKLQAQHRAEWSDLLVEEKTLGGRWLEYEDNPEMILRYPIMRQLNDPKVAPVVEAMGRAKAYRAEEPPDLDENPVETEYAKAVSQFRIALDEAERYAKKIRWNNFTPEERKKAQQALNHLKRAMDTRNYPGERRTAYERVAKLMEDLMIPASPRALLAIEESVGKLELTK